jgi:hypothetical protein
MRPTTRSIRPGLTLLAPAGERERLARRLTTLSAVALYCCALGSLSAATAQTDDGRQRDAVNRLLTVLRTEASIEHFVVALQLRTSAVETWGFESNSLGLDEILGMKRHVDWPALRDQIVRIHMRFLSAEQALAAARFFETPPAQRVLAAQLLDLLPSSDPLRQAKLGPPTAEDERTFEEFSRTPLGSHLARVNPTINAEAKNAVESAVDAAIEKYVADRGLPNQRLPRTPSDGHR